MSYASTTIKKLRYLINRDSDQLLVLEKNNGAFDIIALDTPAARDAAVSAAVNNLLAGVPGALDTLNELATALGDDANFAATVTTALGNRLAWKGPWAPTTAYSRNDLVLFNGGLYASPTNFTSGGSFVKANWTELVPQTGTFIATTDIGSAVAPAKPVGLFIRAYLPGFEPIGFDPVNSMAYLQSDATGKFIYKTSDPDLTVINPCSFSFPAGSTPRQVKFTAAGTMLSIVTTGGVNNLYRSTDAGATAAIVLANFGNVNTGTLQQNIAQNPVTGAIILCEYDAVPSSDTFKTHISHDDGATWTDLETFAAVGGHIHGIFEDPTIHGRLWRCWGDTDAKCKIEYTEDDGTTWTTFGSGDQSWRAVALLFTPTEIVTGADTPTRPENVVAIDKVTKVRRTLLYDAGNTIYYAGQDAVSATGRHMWATGSSAADGQGITLWTGKLDGSTPMQEEYIPNVLSGATQNRLPMVGPTSTGIFFVAVSQIVSGTQVSKLFTCQLVDKTPGALQVLPLANPLTPGKPAKPTSVRVGDRPGLYTTTLPLTNGREYMHKFTAPTQQMGLVTAVYLKNGSAVAGNISVAIRATKTNGDPDVVLSQSAAVPQAGTSVEQKHTLLTSLALTPGQDYWFTVVGTSASGLIVAGGSTFDWQAGGQISKYCDQGAGVCPVPVAAPVSLVAGYDLVALITLA